jgi:hypothetical protein
MKRLLLLLIVLLVVGPAQAQSPVIRASLSPSKNVIVGQPVHLRITILVPNYFTGSPDFPAFAIDNAIVVEPQDRPEHLNDTIGGTRYAGISQTYTIYPQQPGKFELPPAQFTVPYAAAPPKTTVAHLSLPPLTFQADIPAAARDLPYFLPTSRLVLQQKWDTPLKNVRVGDTLHRTISVVTTKTQGMMIPPIQLDAPDGVRLYKDQPTVVDQKTPTGEFVYGRRTESANYFLQKAGDYTLAPIQIQWWNLNTNSLAIATLPEVHLSVAANPDYVEELPPEKETVQVVQPAPVSFWRRYRHGIRIGTLSLVGTLLLVWLGWRYLPRMYVGFQQRLESRRNSEEAYFNRLIHACRSNNPAGAYRGLLAWISRSGNGPDLNSFLQRADDEGLKREVEELGRFLYSGSQTGLWKGERLASLLAAHRHTVRQRGSKAYDLAPLNFEPR